MSRTLSFSHQWMPATHGTAEIRQTSALVRMVIGNHVATRHDNDWAKSVSEVVRLSTYPLALWFAASWWRLRWEPTPHHQHPPGVAWRMAHAMAGAGHGFLWPPVCFESDGETITLSGSPSSPDSAEPIRYLNSFRETIPAGEFEVGIDLFIQEVLARLNAMAIPDTDLHALWREVLQERADPQTAAYRKLEAILGHEPDEAPEQEVNTLQNLMATIGANPGNEIAAACTPHHKPIEVVHHLNDAQGIQGNLAAVPDMAIEETQGPPWVRGRLLARKVRGYFEMGQQPISDKRLGSLLGLTRQQLLDLNSAPLNRIAVSLAKKETDTGKATFLFRRKNETGRRFEASRLLAAALISHQDEALWLPATDAETARQKMQRAFAAEFLVPIDALRDFFDAGQTMDDDRIEEAARHFMVSPRMVASHLANHHMIPPEHIDSY